MGREGKPAPLTPAPLTPPGFDIAATLTIGLGSGATTAIFSVVDGVLHRPLDLASTARLHPRVTGGGDWVEFHWVSPALKLGLSQAMVCGCPFDGIAGGRWFG